MLASLFVVGFLVSPVTVFAAPTAAICTGDMNCEGGYCELGYCVAGTRPEAKKGCGICALDQTCENGKCVKVPTPAATGTSAGSSMKLDANLGFGNRSIFMLINNGISAFLTVVGALALLVFIYGGAVYMTAGGSERVSEARDTIKYAAIGLAIIMFAYTISSSLLYALGG